MTKSTSDVLDEREDAEVCLLPFRMFGRLRAVEGRVRTVRCFEDNLLLRSILAGPSTGEVLVVDGGGSVRTALMGDMIATLALGNGWRGVVINGAIRDSAQMHAMDLHVKALTTNPRKSAKQGKGECDVAVEFGGVRLRRASICTAMKIAWWSCDSSTATAPSVMAERESCECASEAWRDC